MLSQVESGSVAKATKDQVAQNEVKLEFISTAAQVADIFTKPLAKDVFERLRTLLGVVPSH